MWVGVGRLVLDFYNNEDLRLKARGLEELCKDLRKKYNLSVLEIDEFEEPERCVIGFAAVMPATWQETRCKDFVQKIRHTIDETSFARVVVDDWDLLRPLE